MIPALEVPNTHILVPVGLYEKLCSCYYGNGPNYKGRSQPPGVADTTLERMTSSEDPEEDSPSFDPKVLEAVEKHQIATRRVVPYGEAAKLSLMDTPFNGPRTRVETHASKPD